LGLGDSRRHDGPSYPRGRKVAEDFYRQSQHGIPGGGVDVGSRNSLRQYALHSHQGSPLPSQGDSHPVRGGAPDLGDSDRGSGGRSPPRNRNDPSRGP
jgi:hypothetical protein